MNPVNQSRHTLSAKALAVWCALIVTESLHGIARVLFLQPRVGDFRARQIAVFTGMALILAIVFVSIRWLGARSRRALIGVGLLWLALTLLFEMSLGVLVLRLPWERIASDYRIERGGLLPFGLLFLAASPLIAAKLRAALTP